MSGECFVCESNTFVHHRCTERGCTNKVHGTGPEGLIIKLRCEECREGTA